MPARWHCKHGSSCVRLGRGFCCLSSKLKSKLEVRLRVAARDPKSVFGEAIEVEDRSEPELGDTSGTEKVVWRESVGRCGVEGGSICSCTLCSTGVGCSESVVMPVDIDEVEFEGTSTSSSRS